MVEMGNTLVKLKPIAASWWAHADLVQAIVSEKLNWQF